MNKFRALAFIILGLLSGCSLFSSKSPPIQQVPYNTSEGNQLSQSLYSHYQSWKGVEHRDGGMDRSGIDCSGFVHLTFRNLFNKSVPRTTELLSEKGKRIKSEHIKTGDLVFFKTGFKRRHVGIYMSQNKFIHVSSKRGVMMSDLNNPYWKDAFWQIRRLP